MLVRFTVNGEAREVEVEGGTPLLWVLRDTLALCGTKFGCGMALCGACTVHVDGKAVRSCVLPIDEVEGHAVTTIEALAPKGERHPLQQAWIDENVPQCGWCQPGQIMSAAALLAVTPSPSDDDVRRCLSGNLCRCGMYQRIEKAVRRVASLPVLPEKP
jgi:isoquinoline 1-oxidoreductase subunit alpha